MWAKRILAVLGIMTFFLSIGYTAYLTGEKSRAERLGNPSASFGYWPGSIELHSSISLGSISLSITTSDEVMTESDSESVTVTSELVSRRGDAEGEFVVSLFAPGFDIGDAESKIKLLLIANEPVDRNWIVMPKKIGKHILMACVDDQRLYRKCVTKGVVVTNTLGLTAQQAAIGRLLAAFVGPALTIPWLYDKYQKRKASKQGDKLSNG